MENTVNESWTEISITINTKDIEAAGSIANMVVPYGIYIEDYSCLEEEVMEIAHIDLIDEKLLQADRTKGIVHVYVNPHENPLEAVSFIKERLDSQQIEHTINIADCATEDWVNNWKQYFHPMPIGNKLLIRPTWEDEYDPQGRTVLHIEPGLAFGTGSHPTTKLCLETLEKYIDNNSTVLDIGCGSGILSIAALLLGAKSAFGVDIDSLAVKTAMANAQENNLDESKFTAVQGNLSDKVSGKYSVVVANIVADIIIQFNEDVGKFMTDDAVYITGGIIETREDEVLYSFAQNDFEVIERFEEKGWLVFVLKKQNQ
ncbi:MAG: 50S ribosomal protein L11 methyltransferase [Acetobacter sp.]|nr:50S ribosomal protein L11 methyltransferase [Bacteroides sp.]MCM1341173.1 50S ribosomal protein L11 methyltransferase [Acetobacter sp.]MCM1433493.1 50S ribosomal protein L11 methyltransferase [Clostridiales bacterium]